MKYLSLCFCLLFLLYCRTGSNNSTNIIDTIETTKKKVDTIRIVDTAVIGRAYYFYKGGAFVENDTCIYYIYGTEDWKEDVYGKIVKVSGKLLVTDYDPYIDSEKEDSEEIEDTIDHIYIGDYSLAQRVLGVKYTILNPKWELVDTTRKKRKIPDK